VAIALTKRYQDLVARLVKTGRCNNQSEVARAGLRLLEEKELGYLPPVSLPLGKLEEFYARQSDSERKDERRTVAAGPKPRQAESISGVPPESG
jgi:putative addiction module CopG family antidote